MHAPLALEVHNLSKTYPNGNKAVEGVSFDLRKGEIHALVGENGAGKSTVMKMLYGLERPTAGEILVEGKSVAFRNPQDAIALGVGLVHQHLMLIDSLTVAENVTLGSEHVIGPFLHRERMQQATRELAKAYGLEIDPEAPVRELPVGLKQRIEILKALYKGAKILLLDEPTAVLTPQETHDLFKGMRGLVDAGMSVIFITHKLAEVKAVADRITVLRDGRITGRVSAADVEPENIAELMVGRAMNSVRAQRRKPQMPPLVAVRDLTTVSASGAFALKNVSFDIRPGEIVGVAGVEGNGQTELAQALVGLTAPLAGAGLIGSELFTGRGVGHARALGISNIPEDRMRDGVAAEMSIEENLIANQYRRRGLSRTGLLDGASISKYAAHLIAEFGVKTQSPRSAVGSLSGGNMQKVVLGREVAPEPRFLIAAQPTRGVDIGAAETLRQRLLDLRDRGAAILLISADLDEVMALSDRLIVLYKGEVVARLPADAADQNEVGLYMLGLRRQMDTAAPALQPEAATP